MSESRRDFLKLALPRLFALKQVASGVPFFDQENTPERPTVTVEVPPTIMLHARERHVRELPGLIDNLIGNGYQPITYKTLYASLENGLPLPEKPVILSFDDITMVEGSSNFDFYSRVVDILVEKGVPAVFAVNTEQLTADESGNIIDHNTTQNDSYWETARSWIEDHGIELATHTTTHLNLTDRGISQEEYDHQIVDSARMIEERTGQVVETLVLPFGNGATDAQAGVILPQIVTSCLQTNIRFVSGIAGGRNPISFSPSQDQDSVYYVGRIGPNDNNPDADSAFSNLEWEVEHWLPPSRRRS